MSVFDKIKKLISDGKTEEAQTLLTEHMSSEKESIMKKNDELMTEVKQIKKTLKDLQDEKEKVEKEGIEKSGDVEKIKEQHKKEIEKLNTQIQKMNTQLETHVIGEGLTNALVKAKVAPALMDAAAALIRSKHKGEVGDNDGKPFAKFDGKSVDDFVTSWAQTEGGKHFVSAAENSGGGAGGANGSGGAGNGKKTMKRSDFNGLGPVEQAKVAREVNLVD